jgi:diamine N-acetyltransferase
MIVQTKDFRKAALRRFTEADFDGLHAYLQRLSPESKSRFGPHPYDKQAIRAFYQVPNAPWGYVAEDSNTNEIVAYSIIKPGFLPKDGARLVSYGLLLNAETDCTFAPSVADEWQSCGLGNLLFRFILADVQAAHFERIILWGGVQSANQRAVNYYQKHGFVTVGQFQNEVHNFDMIRSVAQE